VPTAGRCTVRSADLTARKPCSRHHALPELRGRLKIIAAIEDVAVITLILTQLGLPARAPPRAPRLREKSKLP